MSVRLDLWSAAFLAFGGTMSSVASAESVVTSADYVQDGLVAQWDGIDNVARGTHDSTARYWADVSGNGHMLTNFLADLTWTDDNGLQMPSAGYEKAATTPAFGLPNCVSYEVVFKQTSSPNNGMIFCFGNFRGCFIAQNRKGVYLHSGSGSTWTSSSELALNQVHNIYAAYQDGPATLGESVEVDGQALTASDASLADQTCSGSYGLGYKHGSLERTNRAFFGKIYAIRVYSRKLSAAEREWNRTLDSKRFVDPETPWNPPAKVTPTVTVDGSGSVSTPVETSVGEMIRLTATPAAGYAFGYWSGDVPDSVDVTDTNLVFKATGLAPSVTAHFQQIVYVAADGNDANGGTSWDDAFATIQAALASCEKPYVKVGPGVYASKTAITVGKAATVAGTAAGDVRQSVCKLTAQAGAAFVLTHANARLSNLAITTGGANGHGVCLVQGGLVDHCTITNCYSYQNNYQSLPVPSSNFYDPGAGALLYYGGHVSDCLIADCQSWCNTSRTYCGGGVQVVGRGLVERCQVLRCHLDRGSGGGVALSGGGILRNSLVSGCYLGTGDSGTGVFMDAGSVENCTIAGNCQSSSVSAKGLHASGGAVRNSVIWGNTNQAGVAPTFVGSSALAAYCTSETSIAGEGNLTTDPMFKDAAHGDYTLTLSDCVDAGTELRWHEGAKDLKGDDRVIDGVVDLGCYEFKTSGLSVGIGIASDGRADQSEATFAATLKGKVGGTVSYAWKIAGSNGYTNEVSGSGDEYASVTRNLAAGAYDVSVKVTNGGLQAEGTASHEILSTHTYVAVGGTGKPPYAASNPGGDIQTALASTANGGTVHLAAGFYTMSDCLSLIRPVRILADGGQGTSTVYAYPTSSDFSIVYLNNGGAVLDGVTVSGYSEDRKTRPTQDQGMAHGVLIGSGGGTVTNCIVDGVSGNTGGGGICLSAGLVTDSIIRGNVVTAGGASKFGGGVRILGGTVSRCVISNNTAAATGGSNLGGGVYLDGGRLENSHVVGNKSDLQAGGVRNAGGAVVNCLVARNSAKQAGTGLHQSGGTLLNVTVAGNCTNAADVAGCVVEKGMVKNCLVWGNEGTVQLSASQAICDDPSNFWREDPRFRNVLKGDYRPRSFSPCIDAGDDSAWTDISGAVDLSGGPRRLNKHVDIGCYESRLRGLAIVFK